MLNGGENASEWVLCSLFFFFLEAVFVRLEPQIKSGKHFRAVFESRAPRSRAPRRPGNDAERGWPRVQHEPRPPCP